MNENDAYIFEVEEPTQWEFHDELVLIQGWFISKQDAVFSDLRAVLDGVPHPGIWGLPRKDIELKHRNYFGLPHAGFELKIHPPMGANLLRLELRDAGGNWVEIWRQEISVKTGSMRNTRLNTGILPVQLRKLLQRHRSTPDEDLAPYAKQLALESATPKTEISPQTPFFGALEKPLLTGESQFGKLNVEGWITHQDQKIRRLIATTDPLAENEMDYGDRPRPEIARRFPDHPQATHPQFFGMIDIDEQAGDPAYLNIFAELEDGSRHLVFARRFHQLGCVQNELPLPVFSRPRFFSIVRLFVQACRGQNIKLGPMREFWSRCSQTYTHYRDNAPSVVRDPEIKANVSYDEWLKVNQLTSTLRNQLEQAAGKLEPDTSRFVLLIDARGCNSHQMQDLATSLQQQIHPSWEAWWIGACAAPASDIRFKSEPCPEPDDFVPALNRVINQAQGSHVLFLPAHSRLSPDALLEIALRLGAYPNLELVYTDEDSMDDAGVRSEPDFKPDWSPTLVLSGLFPGLLSVMRRDRLLSMGGFRTGYASIPWHDALLRLTDTLTANLVAHIPLVCHHARASVPRTLDLADPSIEQSRQALADTMTRRNWAAAPLLPEIAHHRSERFHQLRWSPDILKRFQVTIVIPTRDRLHLLQECIELLEETVDWQQVKLIIVDDHSRDADMSRYLATIRSRTDLQCTVVRPPDPHAPFNYSKLVNTALPLVDTELILHLNNDVNALERGWVEEMAGWFVQDDVGIVGAKLVYPDKSLNHTGIVIGPHGGLADTPFAKSCEDNVDVKWHGVAREVSAVTGACLMTRTSLYQQLGGFDEKEFGVAYNDVDYCLRIRAAGQRVIYTPQAKLMHWGSATRGVTFDEAEHIAFLQRYPGYTDPYFSPHWRLDGNTIVCAGAHHARPDRAGQLHVLLITHNLNLEGAPLFILEYAQYLVRTAGFKIEVLAGQEGPLRAAFEDLGSTVTLIDPTNLTNAEDDEQFHSRVADLAHTFDWGKINLVVCNTLVSFWGVHLARIGGCPSLFYIHESTSIFRFFQQSLKLEFHHLVKDAFSDCTQALFLCEATRKYYEDYNLRGNFRTVPSWITLENLEEFKKTHPRDALRTKLGFADDEIIIANIGTVCERKGQHIFIRAVEHFNRQHKTGPKVRFLLVGARPGIYLDLLKRDIDRMALPNLSLVPETRDVYAYFIAADMFVCSSYEESFPRVLMEAMVFRTPIVTTDVHGIPELVQQRADAYLVPPGDHLALSRMMWTCMAKERSGKSLAPTAYSKVLRYQDHRQVLPQHVILAQEAYLSSDL